MLGLLAYKALHRIRFLELRIPLLVLILAATFLYAEVAGGLLARGYQSTIDITQKGHSTAIPYELILETPEGVYVSSAFGPTSHPDVAWDLRTVAFIPACDIAKKSYPTYWQRKR
jgi:hypothetical protein